MLRLKQLSLILSLTLIFFTGCTPSTGTKSEVLQSETNEKDQETLSEKDSISEESSSLQSRDPNQKSSNEILRYEFNEGNENEYLLPLYGLSYVKKEVLMTVVVEDYTKIKKGASILETAKIIAEHVSEKMGGLKIAVEIEELEGGVKCLNIELIEHDNKEDFFEQNWSQSFAASGVATETLNIIIPNFLQKNYKGPWIDLIRFEENGDGITKHEYVRFTKDSYTLE